MLGDETGNRESRKWQDSPDTTEFQREKKYSRLYGYKRQHQNPQDLSWTLKDGYVVDSLMGV